MRDFDLLDAHSFKAFWAASEHLNFTEAAKQSGLTQSGISQHVSRLEQQLGVPLFQRINKRVFLTEAGKMLRSYIDEHLDRVERLKEEIGLQEVSLSGVVSYAMPASCLMSPHFSLLLKRRRVEFPDVQLKVTLGSNDEIIEMLIQNEIQFGFVTKKTDAPGVALLPFCMENYLLIGSDKTALKSVSTQGIRELGFIDHPGVDVLFDHWRRSQFPKAHHLTWGSLNVVGSMNSLDRAIQMVEGGMGLTVVPEHCVKSQLSSGTLERFVGSLGGVVSNQIYIVTLDRGHVPRRVQKVIETFLEMV